MMWYPYFEVCFARLSSIRLGPFSEETLGVGEKEGRAASIIDAHRPVWALGRRVNYDT